MRTGEVGSGVTSALPMLHEVDMDGDRSTLRIDYDLADTPIRRRLRLAWMVLRGRRIQFDLDVRAISHAVFDMGKGRAKWQSAVKSSMVH